MSHARRTATYNEDVRWWIGRKVVIRPAASRNCSPGISPLIELLASTHTAWSIESIKTASERRLQTFFLLPILFPNYSARPTVGPKRANPALQDCLSRRTEYRGSKYPLIIISCQNQPFEAQGRNQLHGPKARCFASHKLGSAAPAALSFCVIVSRLSRPTHPCVGSGKKTTGLARTERSP